MLPVWRLRIGTKLFQYSRNFQTTPVVTPHIESQIEPPPQILPEEEEPSDKFPSPPDPLSW